MNPDGHEKAYNAVTGPTKDAQDAILQTFGRENANNVDLNRNFPDQFKTPEFPQPTKETQLVMKWMEENYFVLSLNMHSGALVANYPFDNSARRRRRSDSGSISDDDDVFQYLANVYAKNHPTMHEGRSCESDKVGALEYPSITSMYGKESFPGGIVNGKQWYPVAGGMQDWNYVHTNCMELTIETGCVKYPSEKYLPQYWEDNKLSVIEFIEQSHMGIIGIVTDSDDQPIKDAGIEIHQTFKDAPRQHIVRTSPLGDFFRPLLPGQYKATVFKDGYWNETHYFVLTNDYRSLEQRFTLDKYTKGEVKPVHKSGYFHHGMSEDHLENQINSIVFGEYGDYGHTPDEFKAKNVETLDENKDDSQLNAVEDQQEEPLDYESTPSPTDAESTDEITTTSKPTTTIKPTTTSKPMLPTDENEPKPNIPQELKAATPAAKEPDYETDDYEDFADWDEDSNQGSWLMRFVAIICISAVIFCLYIYVRKRRSISGSGAFFIPSNEGSESRRKLLQTDSEDQYVVSTMK